MAGSAVAEFGGGKLRGFPENLGEPRGIGQVQCVGDLGGGEVGEGKQPLGFQQGAIADDLAGGAPRNLLAQGIEVVGGDMQLLGKKSGGFPLSNMVFQQLFELFEKVQCPRIGRLGLGISPASAHLGQQDLQIPLENGVFGLGLAVFVFQQVDGVQYFVPIGGWAEMRIGVPIIQKDAIEQGGGVLKGKG